MHIVRRRHTFLFFAALTYTASFTNRAECEVERPIIVILVDEARHDVVSAESFRLALTVQLEPYGITTTTERWTPPSELEAQSALATQLGTRPGAHAIVWYSTHRRSADRQLEVVVNLLEAVDGRWHFEQIDIGPPGQAIERSMAAAVRTFLQQQRSRREMAPDETIQQAPVDDQDDQGHRAIWTHISLGYRFGILPLGSDLRHGPELAVGWLGARSVPLIGNVRFSYGGRLEGQDEEARWLRHFIGINGLLAWVWTLTERIEVFTGADVGVSLVVADSQSLVEDGESEAALLWELSLGVAGGLAFNIVGPLWAKLDASVAWLPVAHELFVRGRSVGRSGNLQISLASSLYLQF